MYAAILNAFGAFFSDNSLVSSNMLNCLLIPTFFSMSPADTSVTPSGRFLSIFSGSVVIENTFSLNGMGKLYWTGLNNNDFELVLAIQMFYSVVSLVGALLIDISYGLVDPRVRVDK